MSTLYHYPLCPHSRFVRLALGEYGVPLDLAEERVWERRHGFLVLNPAGETPVLVEPELPAIAGPGPIAEYLDEAHGPALDERRLLPSDRAARIEVRRLLDWFNRKFYEEVSQPLLHEKVYKRFMPTEIGGGAPEMPALRAAKANVRYHLRYLGHLLAHRNWIAADRLTYADLAAAAHLSVVDYLGDVPWDENEAARAWYARLKSRPSFRPLLGEIVRGVTPPPAYADLDF
jgi:glutathione S-transferase